MGELVPTPNLPVSRQMREAGAAVLQEWHGILDSESLAEHVYSAMEASRVLPSTHPTSPGTAFRCASGEGKS